MKKFITTPIFYVNASPHIGHAYTTVAADVYARFCKLIGEDVYFLAGTDEHGAKIAKSAAEKGITPQELADSVSQEFRDTWDKLEIKYDQFIRTTDSRHVEIVRELLQKIYDKGHIYAGDYEGLYCVGCEEYKKEIDLIEGNCPIHKKKVDKIKEKVWFFKLSSFTGQIKKLIEDGDIEIFPASRRNEVLSFLNQGLDDIALSRSQVDWGIRVPWDETQTVYVWVDALINYYSGAKIAGQDLFPADIHFIGKDILRFHAVIWPALLLAAELPAPKKIAVHGFFTVDSHKMSKSLGNVIRPDELVKEFGVEGTRYLLLSQFTFGQDGDFSHTKLTDKYGADLANALGNLVQRTVVLSKKLNIPYKEREIILPSSVKKQFENLFFLEAIDEINQLVRDGNSYVDDKKPWQLGPSSKEATEVMETLHNKLIEIALSFSPVLPSLLSNVKQQLKSQEAKPLFPRLDR